MVRQYRQTVVKDYFEKNDIECEWQSVMRMSLNGLNFTWLGDYSGIEFSFHNSIGDQKDLLKMERIFRGQRINEFDVLVKLIKKSKFASRKMYATNQKLGVFEKVKRFTEF